MWFSNMNSLLLIVSLFLGLGLSLLFTHLLRSAAVRLNLVDRPDGRRKVQTKPVPVAGGVAVLLSVTITLLLVWLWSTPENKLLWGEGKRLAVLLLAGTAICFLGVVDDFGRLRGRHKLLGQVLVASAVALSDVWVDTVYLFSWKIDLGLLSFPFTVFLLLGAINSLNLLDGMDGLLGSVGGIICLTLAAMAWLNGSLATVCITLALAGALLGFLRYNFPPASVYLGDGGSMLIGLLVGVLAIESSLKSAATVALAAPLGLLTIPIFDTTAAILRRKLTGRSIYSTDRGHIHHCLLRHGWGTRRTLLLVSGFCLLAAGGALASLIFKMDVLALLSAVGVVAILVAGRLFGHAELALVAKRTAALLSSLVRFPAGGNAREYEIRLQGSVEWGSLWAAVNSYGEELNLCTVRLDINAPALHENYHARWDRANSPADTEAEGLWRTEIPLTVRGQVVGRIQVTGQHDGTPIWEKVAALARIGEDFEKKAALLTSQSAEPLPHRVLPVPHLARLETVRPVGVAEQN
jgi:UDP-GlcNAc:undecaprenyl-phosphate GlcNAc-1-phosphate transferase